MCPEDEITTEDMIGSLAKEIPRFKKILGNKGVGLVTAAGFEAKIGDMSQFSHPRQIQKLAGLSLK
ncbi:transposase [Acetivibrio clariflavus]|uniref:transposase n=1 Tax=Acetivibrio clariflavus TaxID=288965 RepID=UPI0002D48428|nr:transposase [Acetivibrio clariflavus]HPT77362.1 transposase [Defluviitaleaceae bacterium]